jgi:hypothetical protein
MSDAAARAAIRPRKTRSRPKAAATDYQAWPTPLKSGSTSGDKWGAAGFSGTWHCPSLSHEGFKKNPHTFTTEAKRPQRHGFTGTFGGYVTLN